MSSFRFNKSTGKIEKNLDQPFYTHLNLTLRNPTHGKHRRTSSTAHRDPSDGADQSSGGTVIRTSLPASTWRTFNAGSFIPLPGPGTSHTLTLDDCIKLTTLILEEPKPPTLPYAGIRSGEIIGHRLWLIFDAGLSSIAHKFKWEPGATVEGKLDEVVYHNFFHLPVYGGVYAYKEYGLELITEWKFSQQRLAMTTALGLVRGTVKLWGEVIEHETGWRAEFAKLNSIEEVYAASSYDSPRVSRILGPYYASLKIEPSWPNDPTYNLRRPNGRSTSK